MGYELMIETEAVTTGYAPTSETAVASETAVMRPPVSALPGVAGVANAKGQLSQIAQALRWPLPRYEATQRGEPHRPVFQAVATVLADGVALSSPPVAGATKKDAEQGAANALLALLAEEGIISKPR